MKRPLALVGLGFAAALAVLFVLGWPGFTVAAGLMLAGAALLPWMRDGKVSLSVIVLVGAVFLLAAVRYQGYVRNHHQSLEACLTPGTVLETEVNTCTVYSQGFLYRLDIRKANGMRVRNAEISFFDERPVSPGDRVVLKADVSVYRASMADGIRLNADNVEIVVHEKGQSAHAGFIRVREWIVQGISGYLAGEEGALCASLLAGDRSELSVETRIAFNRAGIAHILSVSGLHVSILFGVIVSLLRHLKVRKKCIFWILIVVAGPVAAFYGFTPSVIRACVMAVIFFGADAFYRPEDPITSLAIAALVVLLPSPQEVVGASFLLSFSCIAAIRLLYPPIYERLENYIGYETIWHRMVLRLFQAITFTLVINVSVLPIFVVFDMGFPLLSVLVSPFTVVIVGVLMPLLLILIAVSFVPPVAAVIALLCGILAKAILLAANFAASVSWASISLDSPYIWICIVGSSVLFTLYFVSRKRVSCMLVVGCCLGLFMCGILSMAVSSSGKTFVTIYGDTAVLVTRDRQSIAVVFDDKTNDLLYFREHMLSRIIAMPECVIIAGTDAEIASRRVSEVFPESVVVSWDEVGKESFASYDLSVELPHRDVVSLTANDGTSVVVRKEKRSDGMELKEFHAIVWFADDGFYLETQKSVTFYEGMDAVRLLLTDGDVRKVGS